MYYFADLAAPLHAFLRKMVTWNWTDTEESAMCSLCTALCRHPFLALLDSTKPFQIKSNTSDSAVNCIVI